MPLSPGQILNNRYRIVRLLGQGGFGAVYKAWDLNMERPRALKENLEIGEEAQRQFKREAQILGDLTHPHLPKVIDHFVIAGQGQYLVMEFVEGEDLEATLQRSSTPVDEAQARKWMIQVCDALSYLHGNQPPIIHRDIKPANIKVRADGQAMLVDFGIAKMYDPKLRTTVGARAITPGFSPQEQYGLGQTDARTDIYALGATFYNLVTGQQPPESVQRNLGLRLIPPRQINPHLSAVTEAAILKAMEMQPALRFQSAAELRAALTFAESNGGPKQVFSVSPALQPAVAPARVETPFGAPAESWPTAADSVVETVEARKSVEGAQSEPALEAATGGLSKIAIPASAKPPLALSTRLRQAWSAPLKPLPWQLIAVQSAGLLIAGLILIRHEIVYLGDYVLENTLVGYFFLVCLLMIIDGIRQPPAARYRKWFQILLGIAAIVGVTNYLFLQANEDVGDMINFFAWLLISAGTAWITWKTRDWRVGVLGAVSLLFTLQTFWLWSEEWEALSAAALTLGLTYAMLGIAVLVGSVIQRR